MAVGQVQNTTGKQTARTLSKDFREQALQIINASLEAALSQYPLDIPQIFGYDRPTLGGTVPIQLYRAIRLLAFREVLGSEISAAILRVSGRSVAQKMGVRSVQELVCALQDLSVGKLSSLEQTDEQIVLVATECATCSGLPNIGETICHFETGFIAGGLEDVLGGRVKAVETQCWGLGDRVCRWEARLDEQPARADGSQIEPLDVLMTLAGKAASSVDSAIALRQKNRQLREAYHQLRESERLKRDLTDMVVHDMRVPLTAVMGSIESLADMLGSGTSPQGEHLLKMALSSGQTLLNMINDLLDVSKLEERQVKLRRSLTRMDELVEQAVSQVAMLARRKGLQFDAEVAPNIPEVSVDRDRMVRVLVNLLGNAVHHTSPGGRIVARAIYEPDSRIARVSISDTGEGIPGEYLGRIFDKFVQVESHKSRKRFSTGLGLTFCKLVVEAHGGHIWAESEPGAGSTFTFTLPVE